MFENNIHWLNLFSCAREKWDICIVFRYQISYLLNSLIFAVIVLDIGVHNYLAIGFLKLNTYFQSK